MRVYFDPVQDEEPSVNLYVPANWKKRQPFIAKLKAKMPPGFEHVSQYPDGELILGAPGTFLSYPAVRFDGSRNYAPISARPSA